ncbi:hypothetical protein ACNFCI_07750 [Pseudomonas sp. NY15356]
MFTLTDLFKCLTDETRPRALLLILENGELCVARPQTMNGRPTRAACR